MVKASETYFELVKCVRDFTFTNVEHKQRIEYIINFSSYAAHSESVLLCMMFDQDRCEIQSKGNNQEHQAVLVADKQTQAFQKASD